MVTLSRQPKPLFFRAQDPGIPLLAPPALRREEAVRIAVRALGGMQKEALVTSARSGATWRLASDEGAYLAGLDEAPCPLAFMTVGMVSATLNGILRLAAKQGIALRQLRLVQDNRYTMAGSALQGTMQGGARDVQLTVQLESDASASELSQLIQEAVIGSPVSGLMCQQLPSRFQLLHNGRRLQPARVRELPGPDPVDPRVVFDRSEPAPGQWTGLVQRLGPSPRLAHTVTLAGDSLSAQQDRLLHLRGICSLREDGVKSIDVLMFNPHGSVFRFLSDEAPQNGGGGRAPDALGYVAAGIGFCFMTQFGRFATITRQDLREYRIVQDLHTGQGVAEPVETQVFLETGVDDDAARQMLDMAEQTCFLHALCRQGLKTRIAVQAVRSGPLPALPEAVAAET